MHSRVATGGPTSADAQPIGVRFVANENLSGLPLNLRVALQTKVGIVRDQQIAVDGTVRIVAHNTAFPQRFMLEHEWAALLPVTMSATLVVPRHRQPAPGLKDIRAVRIVALNAVHVPFCYWMMLRQPEFGLDTQVTHVTCRRVFTGIHDELSSSTAGLNMFASRTVARFATG